MKNDEIIMKKWWNNFQENMTKKTSWISCRLSEDYVRINPGQKLLATYSQITPNLLPNYAQITLWSV